MGNIVEANNINIWYEEFGDKNKETILLIMGAMRIVCNGISILLTN